MMTTTTTAIVQHSWEGSGYGFLHDVKSVIHKVDLISLFPCIVLQEVRADDLSG